MSDNRSLCSMVMIWMMILPSRRFEVVTSLRTVNSLSNLIQWFGYHHLQQILLYWHVCNVWCRFLFLPPRRRVKVILVIMPINQKKRAIISLLFVTYVVWIVIKESVNGIVQVLVLLLKWAVMLIEYVLLISFILDWSFLLW